MDYGVVLIMAGQSKSNHSNSGRRLMQPAEVWVSLEQVLWAARNGLGYNVEE